MRRHFKRTQLNEPQTAAATARVKELIDGKFRAMRVARGIREQMAEKPVHQPGRRVAIFLAVAIHLLECQLDLKHGIIARFINARRLAGRADEQAAEEIAQTWMIVPVAQQTFEQIRPPQQR